MKRLTPTETAGLVLAAFLFLGGLIMIIWTRATVMSHFTNGGYGAAADRSHQRVVVTVAGARVIGALSALLGVGIGVVAVHRGKP